VANGLVPPQGLALPNPNCLHIPDARAVLSKSVGIKFITMSPSNWPHFWPWQRNNSQKSVSNSLHLQCTLAIFLLSFLVH